TAPVTDQGSAAGQFFDATHDQRLFSRPVAFPGITPAVDGSDIGSVEVQQACPNGFIQSTPSTPCPPPSGGGGSPTPPPAAAPGPPRQQAAAPQKRQKKKASQPPQQV